MKISAGVAIVLNNEKVLLCHPTNSTWNTNFSYPKGQVEPGEELIDAAIRELMEETSIVIEKSKISNKDNPYIIDYLNKNKSDVYKRVYLYKVNIQSLKEIDLISEVIDTKNLQIEEIDWCGFLSKEEADKKIFWRAKKSLEFIWS